MGIVELIAHWPKNASSTCSRSLPVAGSSRFGRRGRFIIVTAPAETCGRKGEKKLSAGMDDVKFNFVLGRKRRRNCPLAKKMIFLLILWCFVIASSGRETSNQQLGTIDVTHAKPLVGQYLALEGIEAVYQLPSSLENIEGVLFVAHGCSHSAMDWWPKSTACMKCTGLPVEMNIVREAIYAHKFAVIAVNSMNRVHKCWNSKDIPRIQEIVKYFYSNIIPGKNVSFHALGVSSGGSFVGFLSQNKFDIPIASTCIQISSVGGDRLSSLPPTIFVLMSKDGHTINHVKSTMNSIAKSKVLITSPKEIKSEYFHVRSNGYISLEESKAIHASLVENHYLNTENYLVEDPRGSEWRSIVATAVPTLLDSKDSLVADQSTISELLNLAWDMHEITDEYLPEVFSWFKETGWHN